MFEIEEATKCHVMPHESTVLMLYKGSSLTGAGTRRGEMIAEFQNRYAPMLLQAIREAYRCREPLTYQIAAQKLGLDPKRYPRAMGGITDLLDAAAFKAGVPLLAIVAVRNAQHEINEEAWAREIKPYAETPSHEQRRAIIDRSLRHQFTDGDFSAIETALESFDGKGNKAAWKSIFINTPRDEFWSRITKLDSATWNDAIEDVTFYDIGTDTPGRRSSSALTYVRDQHVRDAVLQRARGVCEYCCNPGFTCSNDSPYLETHHIIALSEDGRDRLTNVIALCANHHREAHFGARRERLEAEMMGIVKDRQASFRAS